METGCKRKFAVTASILELTRQHPCCISGDLTFRENITDKSEAMRRMRNFLARLHRKYPGLSMVYVWERQKRGAWHVHYVASEWLDVHVVRELALGCGFGPQMFLQPVIATSDARNSRSVRRAVLYLTKYLTKESDTEDDKGVRRVGYFNGSRFASQRFSWANGVHRLYRLGREMYEAVYGVPTRIQLHRAMPLIVRMGWEVLNDQERWQMVCESSVIRRWWYGTEDSDNPFPF